MPEEDDDALGRVLEGRLNQESDADQQDRETDETDPSGAGNDGDGETANEGDPGPQPAENDAESTHSSKATQSTQSTQTTKQTDTTGSTTTAVDEATTVQSDDGTSGSVRSRSPLPLYVSPELKTAIQTRFEKFNAQRTLNDEPKVQKHKHFMEGLLRAGLDHPDLERNVLEEFEND